MMPGRHRHRRPSPQGLGGGPTCRTGAHAPTPVSGASANTTDKRSNADGTPQ